MSTLDIATAYHFAFHMTAQLRADIWTLPSSQLAARGEHRRSACRIIIKKYAGSEPKRAENILSSSQPNPRFASGVAVGSTKVIYSS